MVYEFDSRVRYSEVDSQGKLTWLALMDYFQDCSVFQSESLGIGVDYLAENHQFNLGAYGHKQWQTGKSVGGDGRTLWNGAADPDGM